MTRDRLGPPGYRQAASFGRDEEAQTFVELEGGGKDAFTRMLRDGLYAAYTWRVRHFKDGETNETTIRFTPDGRPYGFVEQLKEDAPGAALEPRRRGGSREAGATSRWNVDLASFALVEPGQERRPAGRVDHTFTYERPSPTLNEGRYRLRLVVSGDRLTEVTPLHQDPRGVHPPLREHAVGERSDRHRIDRRHGAPLRDRRHRRRPVLHAAPAAGCSGGSRSSGASPSALLQTLAVAQRVPADLDVVRHGDSARRRSSRSSSRRSRRRSSASRCSSRCRSWRPKRCRGARSAHHPQLWRVWSRGPGSSIAVLGRTVGGYLLVSVFFAYDVAALSRSRRGRSAGGRPPRRCSIPTSSRPTRRGSRRSPTRSRRASGRNALFRAVPLAGAALIGDRFGQRRLFLVIGFIVQAIIFGAGHAPYPNQPAYARPVELIIPSIGFGLLYLYFGLLPGHRPALRLRRRLVRAADLPRRRARHLVPAAHGRGADAGAAVDRAVAARAGRPMDRALAGGTERRVDAAAGTRAPGGGLTASRADARASSAGRLADRRRRRAHRRAGGRDVRARVRQCSPSRASRRWSRPTGGRGARRLARAAVARDAARRRRRRRAARVRLGTAGEARRLELVCQLSAGAALARADRDVRRRRRRARRRVAGVRRSRRCGSAAVHTLPEARPVHRSTRLPRARSLEGP